MFYVWFVFDHGELVKIQKKAAHLSQRERRATVLPIARKAGIHLELPTVYPMTPAIGRSRVADERSWSIHQVGRRNPAKMLVTGSRYGGKWLTQKIGNEILVENNIVNDKNQKESQDHFAGQHELPSQTWE